MRLSSRARLTRRALRDMRSIWRWVRTDSGVARADQVIRRLVVAPDRLVDVPALGIAKPDFGAGVRCLVVQPYLVFYRSIAGEIQIVRVIDGRRDLPTAWIEPET